MKLDFLELSNVRTYVAARVVFASGVTLFEGDVGCGKSTLLYAIEFALFGLGDLKASHVLRHAAQSGSVTLGLEVGGKKIVIFRSLERKKDAARQAPGWIEEDGVRTEYSPEEMKARVLTLLGFRENPAARATSWIFRYAVFTPQEEMKQILALRPEERLQTLRKAFGVEEYKTAAEHASILVQRLREKSRELQGQTSDLDAWLTKKTDLEKQTTLLTENLAQQGNQVASAEKSLAVRDAKLHALRQAALDAEREAAEVPLLEKNAGEFNRQKSQLALETAALEKNAARWNAEAQTLQNRLGPENPDPQNAWQAAQAALRKTQEELGAAKHAAEEHALLKSGTCPTCGQHLAADRIEKISHAESRLAQAQAAVAKAQRQEEALRKEVQAFAARNLLSANLKNASVMAAQSADQLVLVQKRLNDASEGLKNAEQLLVAKRHAGAALAQARTALAAEEKSTAEARRTLQDALTRRAFLQAQSDHLGAALVDAEKTIQTKTELNQRLAVLEEKTRWVSDHFIPCLGVIEEHVLAGLNDEFNRLFSRWFAHLLETQDLEAEADSAFTPRVRQQGFEQDVAALSGGEKSALALAYRLALNTLVRQTTPALSHNLLILDEPTDGFSKEQLGRMRAVLHEASAQQVLLVSHERELEAFCDQVFLVEKNHGESTIKTL